MDVKCYPVRRAFACRGDGKDTGGSPCLLCLETTGKPGRVWLGWFVSGWCWLVRGKDRRR